MSVWTALLLAFIPVIITVIILLVITTKVDKKRIDGFMLKLQDNNFRVDKMINDLTKDHIFCLDMVNKKWAYYNKKKDFVIIKKHEELIDFEIINQTDTSISGTGGNALVGGLLFGGLGALVGASSARNVTTTVVGVMYKLAINDLRYPMLTIVVPVGDFALEMEGCLKIIKETNNNKKNTK